MSKGRGGGGTWPTLTLSDALFLTVDGSRGSTDMDGDLLGGRVAGVGRPPHIIPRRGPESKPDRARSGRKPRRVLTGYLRGGRIGSVTGRPAPVGLSTGSAARGARGEPRGVPRAVRRMSAAARGDQEGFPPGPFLG